MLSPRVSRRIDTSGIHLSFLSDSRPESLAWTVISSAPPGTSILSSRRICESGTVGSVLATSGEFGFGPWALPVAIGINGATTSRNAKTLALTCQCLRLWILILRHRTLNKIWQLGSLCCIPETAGLTDTQIPRPHKHLVQYLCPRGRKVNIHHHNRSWTDFMLSNVTGSSLQQSGIRCPRYVATLPFFTDECKHRFVSA